MPCSRAFALIRNDSSVGGDVWIRATDKFGHSYGPVALHVEPNSITAFNSNDIEHGNISKGLPEGVGSSRYGHWQLQLKTALHIIPRAYVRSADGLVASMDQTVRNTHISRFEHHPASVDVYISRVLLFNAGARSILRLANANESSVHFELSVQDDDGEFMLAFDDGIVAEGSLPVHRR